jgi:endoglycosylceramidase
MPFFSLLIFFFAGRSFCVGEWDLSVSGVSGQFLDISGRTVRLHGVNHVLKYHPFVPPPQWDPFYSLTTETDLAFMASAGFNVVRLGVLWSQAEPNSDGIFNSTYLAAMKEQAGALWKGAGARTLIDLHQDLAAAQWCGDGFPSGYASRAASGSFPFPFPLPAKPGSNPCSQFPFQAFYVTNAVGATFRALYNSSSEISQAYERFIAHVTVFFKDAPGVVGIELINEPFPGLVEADPFILLPGVADVLFLEPFYDRLAAAVARADPTRLVWFEPAVTEYGPVAFRHAPGGISSKSVLSWHSYCPTVNFSSGDPTSPSDCKAFFAEQVATRLADWRGGNLVGTGCMITEFGAESGSGLGAIGINDVVDAADAAGMGWIFWSYKGYLEGLFDPDGKIQPLKAGALIRPYPLALAAKQDRPVAVAFNPATLRFSIEFTTDPQISSPSLLFVPQWHYPVAPMVKVNPAKALAFNLNNSTLTLTQTTGSPTQVTVTISPQ